MIRNQSSTLGVALALSLLCRAVDADHPTVAFGTEASGPINTIPATPMPAGAWAAGFRTELLDFDEFSDAQLANFAEQGVDDVHGIDYLLNASLSLAYGLSDDLTVSMRLPWVWRDNIREGEFDEDHGEPEVHGHGSAAGLGDLVALMNYRVFAQEALDIALQLGVKAPSGDTDESDAGERLETEFQPGTGSWDLLIGAAASKSMGRWSVHANLLYNETTEGSMDTELGNALFYNTAVVYGLAGQDVHHQHDDGTLHHHLRWDVMLEINGEKRWENSIADVKENNSGGHILYVSPGLRVTYRKLGAFVSMGYPLIDDTNGVQTDVDLRLVGGIGLTF